MEREFAALLKSADAAALKCALIRVRYPLVTSLLPYLALTKTGPVLFPPQWQPVLPLLYAAPAGQKKPQLLQAAAAWCTILTRVKPCGV